MFKLKIFRLGPLWCQSDKRCAPNRVVHDHESFVGRSACKRIVGSEHSVLASRATNRWRCDQDPTCWARVSWRWRVDNVHRRRGSTLHANGQQACLFGSLWCGWLAVRRCGVRAGDATLDKWKIAWYVVPLGTWYWIRFVYATLSSSRSCTMHFKADDGMCKWKSKNCRRITENCKKSKTHTHCPPNIRYRTGKFFFSFFVHCLALLMLLLLRLRPQSVPRWSWQIYMIRARAGQQWFLLSSISAMQHRPESHTYMLSSLNQQQPPQQQQHRHQQAAEMGTNWW